MNACVKLCGNNSNISALGYMLYVSQLQTTKITRAITDRLLFQRQANHYHQHRWHDAEGEAIRAGNQWRRWWARRQPWSRDWMMTSSLPRCTCRNRSSIRWRSDPGKSRSGSRLIRGPQTDERIHAPSPLYLNNNNTKWTENRHVTRP